MGSIKLLIKNKIRNIKLIISKFSGVCISLFFSVETKKINISHRVVFFFFLPNLLNSKGTNQI